MHPLLPSALLLACMALAAVGVVWLRSTPAGAHALLPDAVEDEKESEPDVLARLRARAAAAMTPQLLSMMSESRTRQLRHRIDAAGRPDGLTLERYVEERAGQTLVFGVLGLAVLVATGSLAAVVLPLIGWFGYDLKIRSAATKRQEQIERDLPDFLDVVTITVLAGLGFRRALDRVAASLGGPVAEEVQTALRQMALGASRRQALEGLRDRNDSNGLDQFVAALLQAEELGTSLTHAMESIAEDLRDTFAQEAKERAAKTAPRINLVVVLVILPGAAMLLLATLFLGIDIDFGDLGL